MFDVTNLSLMDPGRTPPRQRGLRYQGWSGGLARGPRTPRHPRGRGGEEVPETLVQVSCDWSAVLRTRL